MSCLERLWLMVVVAAWAGGCGGAGGSKDAGEDTEPPGETDAADTDAADSEPTSDTDMADTDAADSDGEDTDAADTDAGVTDTYTTRSDTAFWVATDEPRSMVGLFARWACGLDRDGYLLCWGDTSLPRPNDCRDGMAGARPTGQYRLISGTGNCQGPTALLSLHRRAHWWWRDQINATLDRELPEFRGRRWALVSGTYQISAVSIHGRLMCNDLGYDSPMNLWPRTGRYVDLDMYGSEAACVLDTEGWATCWGVYPKPSLNDLGVPMRSVDSGLSHACAIGLDGQIRCVETPAGASQGVTQFLERNWVAGGEPAGNDFVDLDSANLRSCALRATGEVICWGFDGDDTPGVLPGPGRADFSSIDMYWDTYCGMTPDGYFCWGHDARIVDNCPAIAGPPP